MFKYIAGAISVASALNVESFHAAPGPVKKPSEAEIDVAALKAKKKPKVKEGPNGPPINDNVFFKSGKPF